MLVYKIKKTSTNSYNSYPFLYIKKLQLELSDSAGISRENQEHASYLPALMLLLACVNELIIARRLALKSDRLRLFFLEQWQTETSAIDRVS